MLHFVLFLLLSPQSPRFFWPAAGMRALGATISGMRAIGAGCVKPDGQNSVISFVISKWLFPELLFSDRWLRGTEILGTRLIILSVNLARFMLRIFLSCRIQFSEVQQKCDCQFRRRTCVEPNSEVILSGMSASGKC